eukprot:Tbor_TRINITY_DN3670_c0_g1::TRINITY_DN3670_c0_g1_i1::g.392::m.392/K03243/EIF5B; translation initiation factor 5B
MPPKAKPAGKKPAAPLGALAKMKAQLAAKKAEEEKTQKEFEEEERRIREEERLAREQERYEAEQAKIAEEKRKEEERLRKKEEKMNKKGTISRGLEKMMQAGFVVPDLAKVTEAAKNEPPKPVKKQAKKVVKIEVVPEVDDREEWEIEAEMMDIEEEKQRLEEENILKASANNGKRGREHLRLDDEEGDINRVEHLRSPICCVLGHVDTGKTSLLDRIRRTNVQGGECGGITQQIGATFFPRDNLVKATEELNKKYQYAINLPGILVIDTPGHESFSNLRVRGSSICDIAVVVVDIMHGLEPQTRESIKLLKTQKCPFMIALNKVDRLYGWEKSENMDFQQSFMRQKESVQCEFKSRWQTIQNELYEVECVSDLYYNNDKMKSVVCVVPTSAFTGEGTPDLLLLIMELVQRFMENKVTLKDELECTILEVKPIEGHGTTIDVILVNGDLYEGDRIVVSGMDGAFETDIRALLTPQPMKELRVKGEYTHHKHIRASMGVKIAANGLEKAIPGTCIKLIREGDSFEKIAKEVHSEVNSILNIPRSMEGVLVQSSTLGSLEALLTFLKEKNIPVAKVNLGPLHKSHLDRVLAIKQKYPRYACVLAFDVPITEQAQQVAKTNNIEIFSAKIIYHLFDSFVAYNKRYEEAEEAKLRKVAVFPVLLKIQEAIRRSNPMILSVMVSRGNLHIGTPLAVMREGRVVIIGTVVVIHKDEKEVPIGRQGGNYTIKIINSNDSNICFGKHFVESDELVSAITRQSVDAVKNFSKELDQDAINLLRTLTKDQKVPPPKKLISTEPKTIE